MGTRNILLLGFLAIISDLDIILFSAHRFMFHNIFFVLAVFLIFYLIFGRLIGLLSLYFTLSHLLFDLSKPGIAFLYPFTSKLVYLDIVISNTYKWFIDISFGFLSSGAVDPFYPRNYLQPMGSLVLILIVVIFIIRGLIKKKWAL